MSTTTIIFDADDTLWKTQPLYEEAKRIYFDRMETLGFDRQQVIDRFTKTDLENVSEMGLGKERFPTSMILVYEALCNYFDMPIHPNIEQQLTEIGRSVFAKLPELMQDAKAVLEHLRSTGFHLILYTAGDSAIQLEKIKGHGVQDFFDSVYIVDSHIKTNCEDCNELANVHFDNQKKDQNALQRIIVEQKIGQKLYMGSG